MLFLDRTGWVLRGQSLSQQAKTRKGRDAVDGRTVTMLIVKKRVRITNWETISSSYARAI